MVDMKLHFSESLWYFRMTGITKHAIKSLSIFDLLKQLPMNILLCRSANCRGAQHRNISHAWFESSANGKHNINSSLETMIMKIMMMSSNGSIFRVTGPLCGEFTGYRWIPCTKGSDAQLWCKQSLSWWFDTPWLPLWRHCNDSRTYYGFL